MNKDFENLINEAKKLAFKRRLSEYASCRTCWMCIAY